MAKRSFTRREVIKGTGVGIATAGLGFNIFIPRSAHAAKKTLKILQWNHFVPGYDKWFNNTYIKEWGAKNDTEVIVDNIGLAGINARAAAEVGAQKGHDLFMFLWPPPVFEEQVVDMNDVYQECEKRGYGKPIPLAVKSTYNPKTKKYYGFSDSFVPDPVNYRKDLWDSVGMKPDTWDDIRIGGAKIKAKHGIPVGIGLAPEIDTGMAMRAIMYSYGASVPGRAREPRDQLEEYPRSGEIRQGPLQGGDDSRGPLLGRLLEQPDDARRQGLPRAERHLGDQDG